MIRKPLPLASGENYGISIGTSGFFWKGFWYCKSHFKGNKTIFWNTSKPNKTKKKPWDKSVLPSKCHEFKSHNYVGRSVYIAGLEPPTLWEYLGVESSTTLLPEQKASREKSWHNDLSGSFLTANGLESLLHEGCSQMIQAIFFAGSHFYL